MRHNLLDVTFNIPVRIESDERLRNFRIVVSYLQKHFQTNILVGEESPSPTLRKSCRNIGYIHFKSDDKIFYRTRVLNELARASTTPIIVNYDADVLLRPESILKTVEVMRSGECSLAYPYEGMFRNIMTEHIGKVQRSLDITPLNNTNTHELSATSCGGAMFWNNKDFMEVGMENEKFKGWGLEDNERFSRAKKLGKKIFRIPGVLYHLHHSRGINSNDSHSSYQDNVSELRKILEMSKYDLEEYIKTWEWTK